MFQEFIREKKDTKIQTHVNDDFLDTCFKLKKTAGIWRVGDDS